MKEIYSCAGWVLIWLGDAGDLQREAIVDALDVALDLGLTNLDCVPGQPEPCRQCSVIQSCGLGNLKKLLERPWFSRVWVVQEAVLGNLTSRLVLGGDLAVPLLTLISPIQALQRTSQLLPLELPGVRRLAEIMEYRTLNITELRGITLPEEIAIYLGWVSSFECSEQSDRFYGIGGLLQSKAIPAEFYLDFNKPPKVVFQQYAIYLLRYGRAFDILGARSWDRYDGWPTWVPDWAKTYPPQFGLGNRAHLRFLDDNTKIEAEGLLLSTIVTATPPDTLRDIKPADGITEPEVEIDWMVDKILSLLSVVTRALFPHSPNLKELPEATLNTLIKSLSIGRTEPSSPEYETWLGLLCDTDRIGKAPTGRFQDLQDAVSFSLQLSSVLIASYLALGDDGVVFRCLGDVQNGDQVYILHGASRNIILRPCGSEWRMAGSAQDLTDAFPSDTFRLIMNDSQVAEYNRRWEDASLSAKRIVIC
ncbi:hypothetical protein EDB80DRAFT_817964 [Ilyonectria destructans]|nr:hypothetical protein EDB80DRAFT_817964 [Ilyonectria destructans]